MEELDGSARNTKMGMRSFFGALYRNKRPIRHFQSGEGSIRRIGEEACAGLFLRCGLECGVSQDSFSPLGIGDKRELGVRTYRIRPVQVRHMRIQGAYVSPQLRGAYPGIGLSGIYHQMRSGREIPKKSGQDKK